MNVITLTISDDENRLIQEYAKAHNVSVVELIRQSVLEKIEDEIDVSIYHQAMKKHAEDPQDIDFNEMVDELGLLDLG